MRYIFPKCTAHVVGAYVSPLDEVIQWQTGLPNYLDIFDDGSALTKIIKPGATRIFTSLTDAAGFVYWFEKHDSLAANAEWFLVIRHGDSAWNFSAFLGVMRLLKERRAAVRVVLEKKHERMLEYYSSSFPVLGGVTVHGGSIDVVGPAEVKGVDVSQYGSANISNDKDEREDDYSSFVEDSSGALVEISATGKALAPWEDQPPYDRWQLQWMGFPLYFNPGDLPMIATLVEHLKPDTIIEIGAMKYGLTVFLAMVSESFKSNIIALNHTSFASRTHIRRLERCQFSDRIKTVFFTPDVDANIFDGVSGESSLILTNIHESKMLRPILDQAIATSKRGVVAFSGSKSGDIIDVVNDFECRENVRKVILKACPPNGSWYNGSVYSWKRTS